MEVRAERMDILLLPTIMVEEEEVATFRDTKIMGTIMQDTI